MTQSEKDLLLKDLSARLPYGTLVYAQNAYNWYDDEINTQVLSDVINEDYVVKPYLFPLSSMTDEQSKIYHELIDGMFGTSALINFEILTDFFNENHLDYRGLIPMGLAIDATNFNIY